MEENNLSTDSAENEKKSGEAPTGDECVAPGIPIVRSSTPRPLPFILSTRTELPLAPAPPDPPADFPREAPAAPPVPEEALSPVQEMSARPSRAETSSAGSAVTLKDAPGDFIWLFEYALDMDPVRLNRPERLDGSAFAYGPAMLPGYRLVFEGLDPRTGQVLPSLSKVEDPAEAAVWGLLYRVPRRYTKGEGGEIPLLDKVHNVETFVPLEVRAREPYRQRELACMTYVASEATRQQVRRLPSSRRQPAPDYLRRLLQVARRQKLPASYLRVLEELLPASVPAATPSPATPPRPDTEPLPAVLAPSLTASRPAENELRPIARPDRTQDLAGEHDQHTLLPPDVHKHRSASWDTASPADLRWLMAFALYLSLLLLGTLTLAVLQGLNFWPHVFNDAFTPLGIPWYVLLYSLLGGSLSCLISLNRPLNRYPPVFVVLTWFTRPFLGVVLGSFAYLVLNSGAVLLSTRPVQHFALCAVVGGLAGFSEGRLFFRRLPDG